MRKIFVTGIGTDVGKTIVAAVLTEALQADYWKPVQAGYADGTDTETIRKLISNKKTIFHPETYRLKMPASPHAAAAAENISIALKDFTLPVTQNVLIIEGAGGLMVPLNERELVIDMIGHFNAEVVLVARNYLGSINHTLLSAEALQKRGYKVLGIIYSGEENNASERAIEVFTGLRTIGRINEEIQFSPDIVSRYAEVLKARLG